MKFMSEYKELEGKVFNSIDECEDAENKVLKEREAIAEKEKSKSKLKKKLSAEVDKAEEALKAAYNNLEKAQEEVRKIAAEATQRMLDVVTPAKEAVDKAEEAKAEAIKKFNEECGVYQKVYTGAEAEAEFERFNKHFSNIFLNMLNKWF